VGEPLGATAAHLLSGCVEDVNRQAAPDSCQVARKQCDLLLLNPKDVPLSVKGEPVAGVPLQVTLQHFGTEDVVRVDEANLLSAGDLGRAAVSLPFIGLIIRRVMPAQSDIPSLFRVDTSGLSAPALRPP